MSNTRGAESLERLAREDLLMLTPDRVGWPQDVGAVALLRADGLLDENGQVRLDEVRQAIGQRLTRRLRQVIRVPRFGRGGPIWVDDPAFGLHHHVRAAQVPAPADEAALLRTVEGLRQRPLDRAHPLWEMWLLSGMPGRVGVFLRMHHVVADGAAAVAIVGVLFGQEPVGNAQWEPAPAPTDRQLLADNARHYRQMAVGGLRSLAHPGRAVRRGRVLWPGIRALIASGRAPRTSLNRPIGAQRRLDLVRTDLDAVLGLARAQDATLNDVLLTVLAAGLRDMLGSRGERVDHVELRAFVPVSLRGATGGTVVGNQLGMLVAPLPLGVTDPVRRLAQIATATASQKRAGAAYLQAAFRSAPMPRNAVRMMSRQRSANTQVSNVRGPQRPLEVFGAQVLEVFPVVPLMGNLTVILGALSYAGDLDLCLVSDRGACPDADVLVAGVRDGLAALGLPVT